MKIYIKFSIDKICDSYTVLIIFSNKRNVQLNVSTV